MPPKPVIRFTSDCDVTVNNITVEEVRNFLKDETLEVVHIEDAPDDLFSHVYMGDFQIMWNLPKCLFSVVE